MKRNVKKRLFSLFTCFVLAFSVFSSLPPVQAHAKSDLPVPVEEEVTPRSDEIEIHFRTYEGRRQYRIWSLTRNCWLTDWTDVP